jgi:cell wall-associated NlpC family hydrolase
MAIPSLPEYGGWVPDEAMRAIAETWGIPVERNPLLWLPGDVLQIAVRSNPQHFGIYSGAGTFIHAGYKVVRETRMDERWQEKIHAVWRWKELICKSS